MFDLYDWQKYLAEAIYRKMDMLVIAGPGEGKTLPFVLPLTRDESKRCMAVIISPLVQPLDARIARMLFSFGFSMFSITQKMWDDRKYRASLLKEVENYYYRILWVPPKALADQTFRKILATRGDINIIVIDEAHTIPSWGREFRDAKGELLQIRSWLPPGATVVAASSTLAPETEKVVRHVLSLDANKTCTLDRGNDRHNVTMSVRRMTKALDLPSLNFIIKDDLDKDLPIRKTMVFVNQEDHARRVMQHLRTLLPPSKRSIVQAFSNCRDPLEINLGSSIEKFRDDIVPVQVVVVPMQDETGIGKDIYDIARVVQVQAPDSLEALSQRFGRAARDLNAQAVGEAILMAEPSWFKHENAVYPKARQAILEPQDLQIQIQPGSWKKETLDFSGGRTGGKLEELLKERETEGRPDMRNWIVTCDCRRQMLDTYYWNPKRLRELVVPCCDNCIATKRREESSKTWY